MTHSYRPSEPLDQVPLHVVLYDVWHGRGGLTRNALHRAGLLARRSCAPVTVLTVDFNPDIQFSKDRFAEMGLLGEGVVVRNLFEDAGLYGERAETFPISAEESETIEPDEKPCCDRDDISDCTVVEIDDLDGRLVQEHTDRQDRLVSRRHHDKSGRLCRIDCVCAASGSDLHRRLLDEAGRTRVEFLASSGTSSWSILFRDAEGHVIRRFGSQKEMRSAWFDSYAARFPRSIFQAETETALLAQAVLDMQAPGVVKVMMIHSVHLDAPYTLGSPTAPAHLPVLRQLDRFDAFVTVTEEHRNDLELEFGPRATLHAVPHDAPLRALGADEDRDPLLAVGIGRYADRKNWDMAIKAFQRVVSVLPEAKLEIWGSGPLEGEYHALVKELGIGPNVRIMGHSRDSRSTFRRASFSVLVGIEAFGLVLVESMSVGTPAVSFDGKYGPREVIRDGVDGLLVEYGDVGKLADAMIDLFRHPDRARELGSRAVEIDERFSSDLCVDRWLGVYRSALEQAGHRVVLPRLAALAYGATGEAGRHTVEFSLSGEDLDPQAEVRLFVRPRDTVLGARYVPVEPVPGHERPVRYRASIDSETFSRSGEWDAYASISWRNAHRFVRLALSDTAALVHSPNERVAYATAKGNLSWKEAQEPNGARKGPSASPRASLKRGIRAVARLSRVAGRVAWNLLTSSGARRRAAYARILARSTVTDKTVLFETTLDDFVRCNPGAIFLAMLEDPRFADFRFAWAIRDREHRRTLRREYGADKRIRFVARGSREHLRWLATARYIVTNATLPAFWQRAEGQTVLDTWHGVPIKKIGFDMPNGRVEMRNMLRVLVQCDYVLSGSRYESEALYLRGSMLDGIYDGTILEAGHPRVDRTLAPMMPRNRWFERHGLEIDPDKKILLFAPTWRGGRVKEARDTTGEIGEFVRRLTSAVGPEYQVLLKLHPLTAAHLTHDEALSRALVPTEADANELLGHVDLLVTDYSSIFVDYLVTGRPIVFFVPDLAEYIIERGVYFQPEELPGPVCETAESVAEWVLRADELAELFGDAREDMLEELCPREDGVATRRVVDTVFGGLVDNDLVRRVDHGKRRVLIHTGALAPGHVTRSVLALLRRIDADRYDVSVVMNHADSPNDDPQLHRLPAHVRSFLRTPGVNGTFSERLRLEYQKDFGSRTFLRQDLTPRALLRRDWHRTFGDISFDAVVDLVGTSPLIAALFAESGVSKRYLLRRGDLSGKRRKRQRVALTFGRGFTSVLSPSSARFGSMVDPEVVAQDAVSHPVVERDGLRFLRFAQGDVQIPHASERAFVATTRKEDERRLLMDCLGTVVQSHSDARLYLLAGKAEHDRIRELARLGGVSEKVIPVECPSKLAFVSHCECFLAANSDEYPVALLEAAALGMPTLILKTGSAEGAFAGTGRIAGGGAEGLVAAMISLLEGTLTQSTVDFERQNAKAMAAFDALCGGDGEGR